MTMIDCEIEKCAYNDDGDCLADMIRIDACDGCLTYERGEEHERDD